MNRELAATLCVVLSLFVLAMSLEFAHWPQAPITALSAGLLLGAITGAKQK